MGTGPEVPGDADLVLTELDEGFVVDAGSPVGDRLARPAAWAARTAGASWQTRPAQRATRRRAMGEAVAVEGCATG